MKKILISLFFLLSFADVSAQFTVSENHRYLLKDDKPFFWLGDTAWELFHRLNREEAEEYFKKRSEQGFTVIQAVVLAEIDGLHAPNAYGETPLLKDDPSTPNEKYFQHVDFIINKAKEYGLNIGLLPTWGDKVFKDRWGKGPEIFTSENAAIYGNWIGNRYKEKTNIVWILGGDRIPRGSTDVEIWRAMGSAIQKATNGKAIITFHPQPNEMGSAEWFHHDEWLSFNMFQTGHCRETAVYDKIKNVYDLKPVKPVMDGEPIYEDHPVCFNAKDLGTSSAYDVRKAAYLDLFAGAHGHTYGCHDIWQMYSESREGINGPHFFWREAMDLPGANQMKFVRALIESHPILDRIPDQELIRENSYPAAERIQACRGKNFAFVYSATGKSFTLDATKFSKNNITVYWFNPRSGESGKSENLATANNLQFTPPTHGYGQDWVLVADDAAEGY